jgi:hypothetical protein
MHKITVVLRLPKRSPGKSILYAKYIAACMQGNPYFPSPTPPIATLVAHIAELDQAHVVARTKALGTAKARDAKLRVVEDDLKTLRSCVETVANTYAFEEGVAVVKSAGMDVKGRTGPRKAPASIKQGGVSGCVVLNVRHPGIVTSFDWQQSVDGTTWTDARQTVHAKLVLTGLTPGVRYSFRFRTLTRKGKSDWSDPLALLVV